MFYSCLFGLSICKDDPECSKICPLHDKLDPIKENLHAFLKQQRIVDLAGDFNKLTALYNL
jgi:hypothetical protein